MKLSWEHLDAFHAAMISGSTVRASQILGCSQPTISRRIQALENIVGIKLFVHSSNRIRPTKEAEVMFSEIADLYGALDRITHFMKRMKEVEGQSIMVASIPALSTNVIPAALRRVLKTNTKLDFILQIRSSPAVKNLVQRGVFDIGYVFDGYAVDGVEKKLVYSCPGVILYNSDYFTFPNIIDDIYMLSNIPFITYPKDDIIRRKLEKLFSSYNAKFLVKCETSFAYNIVHLVEAGLGVAMVNPISIPIDKPRHLKISRVREIIDYRIFKIKRFGSRLSNDLLLFDKAVQREIDSVIQRYKN